MFWNHVQCHDDEEELFMLFFFYDQCLPAKGHNQPYFSGLYISRVARVIYVLKMNIYELKT